jgi:hypothetical protein
MEDQLLWVEPYGKIEPHQAIARLNRTDHDNQHTLAPPTGIHRIENLQENPGSIASSQSRRS